MQMMNRMLRAGTGTVLALLSLITPLAALSAPSIANVKLPPGFEISVFAENVEDARSLALGDAGTLFVSTRTAGNVYAIKYDGKRALEVITIASGMNLPNGVAFREGALYVAEVNRVLRYDNVEAQLHNLPKPVVINAKLPSERHHGWKFIRFGPDGWLYVPVGAPCNICEPGDPYAAILRMRADGSGLEVYARGVRNSVGFDWHPQTKELWFTDNGRDMLGDDTPPDELNYAPTAGMHFGYPYCHGADVKDPQFGAKRQCSEFTAPAVNFQAHVATLGMRFYTGEMFPAEYRNRIFVAQHGSWNRSRKVGYRVVSIRFKDGKAQEEVFAEGWLQPGEKVWGRPVDILVMPDGALLVSDDHAGAIYRISYRK
jgi:glucose/arabinose dehydrogenase